MKNAARICLAVLFVSAALMAGSHATAQTKVPAVPHLYRLAFRTQELDAGGHIINTRTYLTSISARLLSSESDSTFTTWSSSIRTGTRVPVRTTDKGDFQYIDVGVNIDTHAAVVDGANLCLNVQASISSPAQPAENEAPGPVIRQNQWSAGVSVPIGKPTVIFSSDNLENKGKMQLELTATPID